MRGRRPFVRLFRALRWMHVCSMRPDVDWYMGTMCIKIHFLTWHSGGGGGGVIPLSVVVRAMAIAQHTQLRIFIPASGVPPGQVPADCFPGGVPSQELTSSRWVSFAGSVTVLGDAPPPVCSPDCSAQELICSVVTEEDEMAIVEEMTDTTDAPPTIIPPPPGLSQFSWPYEDWSVGDGQSLFTFTKDLPGWCPAHSGGLPVDVPSLPYSSNDSVTAIMGSSREETFTPLEVVVIVPPVGDVRPAQTDAELLAESSLPTAEGLLQDLLWAPVAPRPPDIAERGDPCSSTKVSRWRLAREGPFLAERSTAALSSFGAGCAFRYSSYRASDYVSPTGEFGIPMHHPRFLEWIGVPESASLLEMGPGRWLNALSRDKAMAAAVRLQRDVCLMKTNLDIQDQYALLLQSTALKMIEQSLGASDFPSVEVAAGALGPRVRRISVQMEAMGLWRPSLDPIRLH